MEEYKLRGWMTDEFESRSTRLGACKVKSLFTRGCLCGQFKNCLHFGFIILWQDKKLQTEQKRGLNKQLMQGYDDEDGISAVEVWDSLVATRPVPYHLRLITWKDH
jgi:hypothetical protein